MAKNLKIMFVPMEPIGHMNACIGVAERLRKRGHKIVFAVSKTWKEILSDYGFVVEIIENLKLFNNPVFEISMLLNRYVLLSKTSSLEKIKIMVKSNFLLELAKDVINTEENLKAIIDRQNPDIFIINHIFGSPSVIYSDKPWVFLFNGNPLFVINDERTPPRGSGYPTNSDRKQWQKFTKISDKLFYYPKKVYNKWLTYNGYPEIKSYIGIPDSPYLNLYGYPEELDYTDIRPMPEKWIRIDSFISEGEEELKIPENFINFKIENNNDCEKFIYLSMGSITSMSYIDIDIIKRLVSFLSKSPHKFIVSKGLFYDKYELADNMWGQKFVPQTKVLPLVDLVITNGENNTITEAFSFGKPMIVMPLFADQFDNAQRIHEKGFGIRLDGHNCTESELLNAIEKLLYDKELKEKLTTASNRIKNFDSFTKAIELIEKLVK